MTEPEFLTLDDVFLIHAEQLGAFGGIDGVRDAGLLESAVMMPQATFGGEYLHAGLFEMAAAYAFHIAENQPFLDGNKRTALASALVFLDINGIFIPESGTVLYDAMIAIANRQLDKAGLSEIFDRLSSLK